MGYTPTKLRVVLDTTKVQIFKQITTVSDVFPAFEGCFRYHKGTDFQANHNLLRNNISLILVVLDTTKVQIFKQITTKECTFHRYSSCFRYHKGTDFQANHNSNAVFKCYCELFQIPQRYTLFTHITQKHADKGIRENSIIYTTNMVFLK